MAAEHPPNHAPGSSPDSAVTEPLDPFLGTVLNDRYCIQDKLGSGGSGVVYRALDKKLHEKPVVVKILLDRSQHREYFEKKFRQESEALTRIRHPGVVGVSDLGETADHKPFIVMDFVDGVTLRSAMTPKTGMELARAARILRDVCNALGAAHDQGVCHRDLKPENILLRNLGRGEEHPVIIDFGIAGVEDSRISGDAHSEVAGTYPYMAPEQFTGHAATQSDIYSAGVIAYELVTGRRPFIAETPVQLFVQQQAGVEVKPIELRSDLPPRAQDVILRALAFDVKDRYQQATEFGEELATALTASALNSALHNPKFLGPREERAPEEPEIASVLFLDIVGFSRKSMEEQDRCKQRLQQIVRETSEFQTAAPVKRDTGDGMVLVFWSDFQAPIRCAISICRALRATPQFELRMGVHAGPIYRRPDINDELNVIGGGINVAQRVMDCGDSGHILVSQTYAEMLSQFGEWRGHLYDLGEHPVKHGDLVRLSNFHTKEWGNPAKPVKLRPKTMLRRGVVAALGLVLLAGLGWGLKTAGLFRGETGATKTGSEAPPLITPSRTLSYYIMVQKYRDGRPYNEPFRLGREMIFESGWRLQFVFGSAEPGYLYLLNEGPIAQHGLPSFNTLFPSPTANSRSSFLKPDQEIHFPPTISLTFDQEEGTEKLWIIWSTRELPRFEALKQWTEGGHKGSVKDPQQIASVRDFLGSQPVAVPEVDDANKRTTLNQKADPLVYLIRLEHH